MNLVECYSDKAWCKCQHKLKIIFKFAELLFRDCPTASDKVQETQIKQCIRKANTNMQFSDHWNGTEKLWDGYQSSQAEKYASVAWNEVHLSLASSNFSCATKAGIWDTGTYKKLYACLMYLHKNHVCVPTRYLWAHVASQADNWKLFHRIIEY